MTTTNDRPFIVRAERWHENRELAASVRVCPARHIDTDGNPHPGVALILRGRPYLLLTLDEFKAICSDLIDAAETARH